MKVIVSSSALLQYLCRIQEFIKGEAKLRVYDHNFEIDGFKGLQVEHQRDIDILIPLQKLIDLKNLLMRIHEQPITLKFDGHWIEVYNILI